jgi:hypothetical protein
MGKHGDQDKPTDSGSGGESDGEKGTSHGSEAPPKPQPDGDKPR